MLLPYDMQLVVDDRHTPETSVVLRYASSLLNSLLTREELLATSQLEGLRIVELESYKGVPMLLLDETTCTQTGTYKSLDGCIAAALCRKQGITQAVFSSGANTGVALTDYGTRVGLETFFFCPASTIYKLEGTIFERPGAHLIAVEGHDRHVKLAAELFAKATGIPLIPPLEWRVLSAAFRGFFLAEQILRHNRRFDWFAQTICAGYGPVGIYQVLTTLVRSNELKSSQRPRFLGVQQAGLCPIVRAWENGLTSLPTLESTEWQDRPIEPSLYNLHPDVTYPLLWEILQNCDGKMLAVLAKEFYQYVPIFTSMIENVGIRLTCIDRGGKSQYLECAGLLAGCGVIKAIDGGMIRPEETVLCALTGGAGRLPLRPAQPEWCISLAEVLSEAVARYAATIPTILGRSPDR